MTETLRCIAGRVQLRAVRGACRRRVAPDSGGRLQHAHLAAAAAAGPAAESAAAAADAQQQQLLPAGERLELPILVRITVLTGRRQTGKRRCCKSEWPNGASNRTVGY